jgi:hypothetical protein
LSRALSKLPYYLTAIDKTISEAAYLPHFWQSLATTALITFETVGVAVVIVVAEDIGTLKVVFTSCTVD